MWTKPKQVRVEPASSINHLSLENITFALALRSPSNKTNKKILTTSLTSNKKVPSVADDRFTGEDIVKIKNQQKPCKLNYCMIVENDVIATYKENLELAAEVYRLNEDLQQEQLFLTTLTKEFEQYNLQEQRMLQKLGNMESEVDDICHKLSRLKKERRVIEDEIALIHNKLQSLHNRDNRTKRGPLKSKKHNGIFNSMQTGTPQWSCCLATKHDAHGCIEDQSVGLKSSLQNSFEPLFNRNSLQQIPFAPSNNNNNVVTSNVISLSTKNRHNIFQDVGKIRMSDRRRIDRNRPMSSPAGYKLYK